MIAALPLAACTPDRAPSPNVGSGARFREEHDAAGISFRHTDGSSGRYYLVETLASGVLLFDYDGDGDLDIYFVNGRPLPPGETSATAATNALYENDGAARFRDVTAERGVPGTGFGSGGAAADYDGDGDLDLYICQLGGNVLYENEGAEGNHRFRDVTARSGADDSRFSAGAAFLDADRDGDLDLYVTNYCKFDFSTHEICEKNGVKRYCPPEHYEPEGHSYFENRGDGTFANATERAGIAALRGRGMGVVAADFNRDGWQDLFVANDSSENFLLLNRQDGTFQDVGLSAGVALSAHGDEQGSMGVDAADFDRDGRLDIMVTNYQKQLNALYTASGEEFFMDLAMKQGLGDGCLPMVSWGTKFFDYDQDGWLDLFIANGHLEDRIDEFDQSSTYLQRNQLFHNRGGGVLVEVTDEAGPALAEKLSSRGAAFGDLDGDGDVDIVISNSRERPSLLLNETEPKGHWALLALRGRRNRFGVGAHVEVHAGGVVQRGVVAAGASYLSQNDLRLPFGLGDATVIERVVVAWPEGARETFRELAADRVHTIEEGMGEGADE